MINEFTNEEWQKVLQGLQEVLNETKDHFASECPDSGDDSERGSESTGEQPEL